MGRPERELDLSNPLHAFAAELRKLREQAANPKYLVMARRSGVSRTALTEAAGGDHLPTWRTVEAYVRSCGGDPADWLPRWETLRDDDTAGSSSSTASSSQTIEPEPGGAPAGSHPTRWRVSMLLVVSVAATGLITHALDQRQPPPAHSTAPPPTRLAALIVQNKVALGASALIDDTTPAYLSSRPLPFCARQGCKITGTELSDGAVVAADCHVDGAWMVNYNLDSTEARTNPNKAESTLWYHVLLPDGRNGYLSEVYIQPMYRKGFGLPVCAHADPAGDTPGPTTT